MCCVVTAGSDFPTAVRQQIEGWGVTVHYDEKPDRLSTRGLLEYENDAFGSELSISSLFELRTRTDIDSQKRRFDIPCHHYSLI